MGLTVLADGRPSLGLLDAQGQSRVVLTMEADGTPMLRLLDAQGRCEQSPDNSYCLSGKLRMAASPAPIPVPPAPPVTQPSISAGTTVCFTPGGNWTELMVKAVIEPRPTLLVQADSCTVALIAKALLDAHKRGVQVRVILDTS